MLSAEATCTVLEGALREARSSQWLAAGSSITLRNWAAKTASCCPNCSYLLLAAQEEVV